MELRPVVPHSYPCCLILPDSRRNKVLNRSSAYPPRSVPVRPTIRSVHAAKVPRGLTPIGVHKQFDFVRDRIGRKYFVRVNSDEGNWYAEKTGCFYSHRSGDPRNPARANSDLNSLVFILLIISVLPVILPRSRIERRRITFMVRTTDATV